MAGLREDVGGVEVGAVVGVTVDAAHQQADLVDRDAVGGALRRQAALVDDGERVGDGEELVEILGDDDDGRAAGGEVDSAWWIEAAAPASTPQVGWETTRTSGTCSTSRPMMNFCRLPPEGEPAVAAGPVALTAKAFITSSA